MAGVPPPFAPLVAVVLALPLVACVSPVPSRGYGDTRGNLSSAAALPIEGRTTREEVLLRLGSPDAVAPDDSRFGYASRRHEGGVGVWLPGAIWPIPPYVIPGGPPLGAVVDYSERRLIIDFDAHGIVSRVRYDEARCPSAVGPLAQSGACLPLDGLGLSPVGESAWPAGHAPTIASRDATTPGARASLGHAAGPGAA